MSGSWTSSRPGRRQTSQASGPSGADVTVTWPSGQYQAGIRCPHHSWRETFQSRMLVIQCSHVFSNRGGRIAVSPERVASRAVSASGFVRMNHWVLSRGSTTSSLRWQRPMTISWACWPARSPLASSAATIPARASYRSRPSNSVPVPATRASSSRIVGAARPWRRPVSWSSWSWAGVIFTAPVPNAGSTTASAMIGTSRSTNGMRTRRPTSAA